MKVYQQLHSSFQAMENCLKSGNTEWYNKHEEKIETICRDFMPSGSGFDCGTKFNFELSKVNQKLVFNSSYHHMNENGYYDGWSELTITVKPSFNGIDIRITGIRRKNSCDNEYFYDTFYQVLKQEFLPTI